MTKKLTKAEKKARAEEKEAQELKAKAEADAKANAEKEAEKKLKETPEVVKDKPTEKTNSKPNEKLGVEKDFVWYMANNPKAFNGLKKSTQDKLRNEYLKKKEEREFKQKPKAKKSK